MPPAMKSINPKQQWYRCPPFRYNSNAGKRAAIKDWLSGGRRMCQARVYLDGVEIMQDVMLVEPVLDGIRLVALFEPVQVVNAVIKQIDLMKHKVILETFDNREVNHE